MSNSDCDVCSGREKIRVPVYPRLNVAAFDPRADVYEDAIQSSREYPCPECSDAVPVERLHVVRTQGQADTHYENDPRFIEHVKYGMTRELAGLLLEQGLVKFERGPSGEQWQFAMRLTIGAVAPGHVATLERRVEQHQTAFAQEVMAEAKRQINHWGSHYGHSSLNKSQACDSVDHALAAVLEVRKKWRAA